uniref:Protein LOW PSII ACCUMULATION 2ic n=1 Tax=Rhizophora mucronata TaxID=61149 RepID=A0A2P2JSC0_RHIMU
MASLQNLSPSSIITQNHNHYHHHPLRCRSPLLVFSIIKRNFAIKSQNPSNDPAPLPPKKPATTGVGFGSSSSATSSNVDSVGNKKKQKGKRERASIIRRSPVEKPALISQEDEAKAREQRKNESAFLLTWLGLGGVILVEGIVLAASGNFKCCFLCVFAFQIVFPVENGDGNLLKLAICVYVFSLKLS